MTSFRTTPKFHAKVKQNVLTSQKLKQKLSLQNVIQLTSKQIEDLQQVKHEFFEEFYPGIKPNESILNMIQLLTTRSPDLMIRSWATAGYEIPVDLFDMPSVTKFAFPQDKKILDLVLDKKEGCRDSQILFIQIH